MQRTVGFWTTWSALKRDWKCSDQWLRMETLSAKSTCPSALCKKFLQSPWSTYCWVLFARLVHHLFWVSQSLRWRMLQMRWKAALLTGHNGWARWTWWDDHFFAISSWISWLFSSNQSLFFLVVNPRTSSDVCRIALFRWSQSVSGEVFSGQLLISNLDCNPAWKSAFTSTDWSLFRLNFFLGRPPFHG